MLVETQKKQIACLTGCFGTLLGALQAKNMLHRDDAEVLVEVFGEISPGSKDRAVQSVLKAVLITAEETPQMMELDGDAEQLPKVAALHVHRPEAPRV